MPNDLINKLSLVLTYDHQISHQEALKKSETYYYDYFLPALEKFFDKYHSLDISIDKLEINLSKLPSSEIENKLFVVFEEELKKHTHNVDVSRPAFKPDTATTFSQLLFDFLKNPVVPWYYPVDMRFDINNIAQTGFQEILADKLLFKKLLSTISNHATTYFRFASMVDEHLLDTIIIKILSENYPKVSDNDKSGYDNINKTLQSYTVSNRKKVKVCFLEHLLFESKHIRPGTSGEKDHFQQENIETVLQVPDESFQHIIEPIIRLLEEKTGFFEYHAVSLLYLIGLLKRFFVQKMETLGLKSFPEHNEVKTWKKLAQLLAQLSGNEERSATEKISFLQNNDTTLMHITGILTQLFEDEKRYSDARTLLYKNNAKILFCLVAVLQQLFTKKDLNTHTSSFSEHNTKSKISPAELLLRRYEQEKERLWNEAVFLEKTTEQLPDIPVSNAGLILFNPMIETFFRNLGYTNESGHFKSFRHRIRAVHVLHAISGTKEKHDDHLLQLNKLICGISVMFPVDPGFRMDKREKDEVTSLIVSVVEHWKALKGTSVAGFQEAFVRRKGLLQKSQNDWILRVENKTIDILLDDLPWSINLLKYPWIPYVIYVDWKR